MEMGMNEVLDGLDSAIADLRNRYAKDIKTMRTIHITEDTKKAYQEYLNTPIDHTFNGQPILRRHTYPYLENEFSGELTFTAGYQYAMNEVLK
jgi:hypothetical protein